MARNKLTCRLLGKLSYQLKQRKLLPLILGDFLFEPQIEFSLECITPL